MNKIENKNYVSPVFQLLLFIVAVAFLMLISYKPVYNFTAYEHRPAVALYSKDMLPPDTIYVALNINSFAEADIVKNNFVIEGIISFAGDLDKIPLEQLSKFTFENGEIIEKSDPRVLKDGGKSIVQYAIKVRCKMQLNYSGYPLDDHTLYLAVHNSYIDATKVRFVVDGDNFRCGPDVRIVNYLLEGHNAVAGYAESRVYLDNHEFTYHYPRVLFELACNRVDVRHFLNILLPLLLIFFTSLFAFSFDFDEHGSTVPSIAIAGVTGLLAYRFVIEAISPDVDYFMLSDYLFFLFLFLVFMIFFFIASALHVSVRMKKIIIVSLYACMLFGCAFLFNVML